MLKIIKLFPAAVLSMAFFLLPDGAHAFTASLVSISPDATDISDQMSGAPEDVQLFAWMTTIDTSYTATFTIDEQPAMVVTPGASITPEVPPTYNAETGEFVVVFTATGVQGAGEQQGQEFPEGQGMSMIGLVGAVEEGQDGPPAEMRGGWMSTDIQQWELVPPSPELPAFGFNLTGPVGETGFLHMFIPDTLIAMLGGFSGEELTVEDLAVFNGDSQASLAVTAVAGGAYIDINVIFSEAVTTVVSAESDTVTKEITVGEQLPISLTATKTTVGKAKPVALYGWLSTGKSKQSVTLWRKLKNSDTYVKFRTLRTKKDGYFRTRFAAKQTASYKVKYNNDGDIVMSKVTTITVE